MLFKVRLPHCLKKTMTTSSHLTAMPDEPQASTSRHSLDQPQLRPNAQSSTTSTTNQPVYASSPQSQSQSQSPPSVSVSISPAPAPAPAPSESSHLHFNSLVRIGGSSPLQPARRTSYSSTSRLVSRSSSPASSIYAPLSAAAQDAPSPRRTLALLRGQSVKGVYRGLVQQQAQRRAERRPLLRHDLDEEQGEDGGGQRWWARLGRVFSCCCCVGCLDDSDDDEDG